MNHPRCFVYFTFRSAASSSAHRTEDQTHHMGRRSRMWRWSCGVRGCCLLHNVSALRLETDTFYFTAAAAAAVAAAHAQTVSRTSHLWLTVSVPNCSANVKMQYFYLTNTWMDPKDESYKIDNTLHFTLTH